MSKATKARTIQDFAGETEATVIYWAEPLVRVGNVTVELRPPNERSRILAANLPGFGLSVYEPAREDGGGHQFFLLLDESAVTGLTNLSFQLREVQGKVQILPRTTSNDLAGTLIEATSDGVFSSKIEAGKIPSVIQVNFTPSPSRGFLVEVVGF
jgi:hypothetical protein